MSVAKEDKAVKPKVPKSVVLAGRKILVKLPTLDQAMEWESTFRAIAKMEQDGISIEDYEKLRLHKDRFYRILKGLFVDDEDKEWLEGARLDGIISIDQEEVIGLMNAVVEAYKDELPGAPQNRVQKRAAARKRS